MKHRRVLLTADAARDLSSLYEYVAIADSSANIPGHSPGARIHDGVGTSSATSRWRVRRSGAAYIMRVGVQVCSANSRTVEVCSKASWPIARNRPSRPAPRRTR